MILILRLVIAIIIVSLAPLNALADSTTLLTAPDETEVTIYRDEYGVPHIVGDSDIGVFFGQGYAVAEDRLVQMEINRRSAKGTLAEIYGSGYVSYDQNTRSLYYTESERLTQFNAMSANFQAMVEAYIAGINSYLDLLRADPDSYCPLELAGYDINNWTVTDVVASTQFLMRRFGEFGGQELTRLNELNYYGATWFDQNRPINDPSAPTTIPSSTLRRESDRRWSGIDVRPVVAKDLAKQAAEFKRLEEMLGLPPKFGSFAVQITLEKSASGNVLLLGCPQMGTPQASEANVVHELELTCPGLHAGGMTVAGIPGIIIGHNENYTWTFTSGISDNVDVYIETIDNDFESYLYNSTWTPFTTIIDTVFNNTGTPYPFMIRRSVHGPVFASDTGANQAFTKKMSFWNNELLMAEAMYQIFSGANLADFEAAIELIPVSFNIFYAGSDLTIKYWHAGFYQDRTDGIDPRLPHNGDGSEEWGGLIPFSSLPSAFDPLQGYFVNWNNKPVSWWDNGDNVPWVGGHAVTSVDNYVAPISDFTIDDLEGTPAAINSHGTYQQAVEIGPGLLIDDNIVPPGQSAFVSLAGIPSPHVDDQWPLHTAWLFKDMLFGFNPSSVGTDPSGLTGNLVLGLTVTNPFEPNSQLFYSVSRATEVKIAIYDLVGRRVHAISRPTLSTSEQAIIWDGRDETGEPLPAGLYLCSISADDQMVSRKIFLLK